MMLACVAIRVRGCKRQAGRVMLSASCRSRLRNSCTLLHWRSYFEAAGGALMTRLSK
jgi:hypothetical protein